MKKSWHPVQWTLPSWAAEFLFETLQRDAQSPAFEPGLRQQLRQALENVTETESPVMTTENILTIGPDGIVHGLWTDIIPLQELGTLEVTRASSIEFDPALQQWQVRLTSEPDHAVFADASRDVCLQWERDYFNR